MTGGRAGGCANVDMAFWSSAQSQAGGAWGQIFCRALRLPVEAGTSPALAWRLDQR